MLKATKCTSIPIINAGSGSDEHPTQSLLDFYTIHKYFPKVIEKCADEELVVSFVGDLKHGRTVHSLCKLLSNYNVRFRFVSCKFLEAPQKLIGYITSNLKKNGFYKKDSIQMFDEMKPGIENVHVIYMTRVQKERFDSEEEYNKYKNAFILDKSKLQYILKDAIIMHPLPRLNEISTEVDNDPRSKYFVQAQNGLYMRMALLYLMYS